MDGSRTMTGRSGLLAGLDHTRRAKIVVTLGPSCCTADVFRELVRAGADKRPYRLVLRAGVTNAAVDGEYTTPRCRYAVHLQPAG